MKLEIGYKHLFEVRKESFAAKCPEGFSILFMSDLHFNRYSGTTCLSIIDKINELNPDIILLGGDYADSKRGLYHLRVLLGSLSHRQNVFAVAGNHDHFFGFETIKDIMHENNVNWIEKSSDKFKFKGTIIRIDGNMLQEKGNEDLSILLLHKPLDIANSSYDLSFAGHLHGSQFVFWRSGECLYPGRVFYKWNRLGFSNGNSRYFISKGMGDTLPIRYNCKKDMIFLEVGSSTQRNGDKELKNSKE
jgi:predicted MPP superfamily phosphohydrolase